MNLGKLKIEKSKPKVYINGREVGHLPAGYFDSLSSTPVRSSPATFEPATASFTFEMKEDAEVRKRMEEFLEKNMAEYIKKINEWIEDCLRNRVRPPIKGEITAGKIRWRGLTLVFGQLGEFYGILQRKRVLYSVDGNTYPDQSKKED